MDKQTALKALSLNEGASRDDIEKSYQTKIGLFEKRMSQEMTDALRTDFDELVERIHQSYDFLINELMMATPEPAAAGAYNGAPSPHSEKPEMLDIDVHEYLKQSEPSAIPPKKRVLPLLAALAILLAIGFFTGILQELWERYRPLSAEEIAARDNIIVLLSDIEYQKTLQQSAHDELIELARLAEEDDRPEDQTVLLETAELIRQSVLESLQRQELEADEESAAELFQRRKYIVSEQQYIGILAGYMDLSDKLELAKQVIPEKHAALGEQQRWRDLLNTYELESPEEAATADERFEAATQYQEELKLEPAIENYAQAKGSYLAAQEAVADEIAQIKARLAASRKKRKAISPDRLAWLKKVTPLLIDIPAGKFSMGSANGDEDEAPVHTVNIKPFRISKYEITIEKFRYFVETTAYQTEAEANADELGCAVYNQQGAWSWQSGYTWQNAGYEQTDKDPAICISWNDANAYVKWLSKEWGRNFRLMSESEWEYVMRAGTKTPFPYGETIGKGLANCDGCGSNWDVKGTAPADSFKANKFGAHAMEGNVFEWTEDCWHDSYQGAPNNGKAWLTGGECGKRVLRGGSWFSKPKYLRSAYRSNNRQSYRSNNLGFRIAESR